MISALDRVKRAVALSVGTVVLLAGCGAPETTPSPAKMIELDLTIGGLLPLTGDQERFGPGTEAAFTLAVQDITEAATGLTVTPEIRDSADMESGTGAKSVTELLDLGASAVVGAISDGVSKTVVDSIVAAGVVEVSPGNDSSDFTRYDDDGLYWRTSAACTLEGDVLGRQVAANGAKTIGIIYQLNYCEPGLPEAVVAGFGAGGGQVVASEPFEADDNSLGAQLAAIVEAAPDAVVILTDERAGSIVPDLVDAGYSGSDLYFVGLSLTDHSDDFPAGAIVGATATRPGIDVAQIEDFTDRILEIDPSITTFRYAAETYDAVILVALAAIAAGDTSGAGIASRLQEVSGGTGEGTKASDFATAADILLRGGVVDYDGPSGAITFDENGDPAGAVVGIYQYGADNTFTRLD